jgi:hypothetical protein
MSCLRWIPEIEPSISESISCNPYRKIASGKYPDDRSSCLSWQYGVEAGRKKATRPIIPEENPLTSKRFGRAACLSTCNDKLDACRIFQFLKVFFSTYNPSEA